MRGARSTHRSRCKIHPRRPGGTSPLFARLALAAAGWLAAGGLAAQGTPPLVTDRPDQTESTGAVPPGFVQFELGWTVGESSDATERVTAHTLPEALLRIGLLPRLEGRVGLPTWSSTEVEAGDVETRTQGLGDLFLGAKLALAEGAGSTPSLALLGGTTIPTGEEGVGSERADPSFRLAASGQLAERLSLGVNAGVRWETESVDGPDGAGLETQADVLYTAALGIGVSERLGVFLESFGFAGLEASRPTRHSVDGGLTLLLAPNLQLDVRGGVGLDDDAEDWFLGTGVSVRVPR